MHSGRGSRGVTQDRIILSHHETTVGIPPLNTLNSNLRESDMHQEVKRKYY